MSSSKRKRKRNKFNAPRATTRNNSNPSSRRSNRADREAQSEVAPVKDTERNNTFGGNSIEWYSRYPNLLMAAGSIPYPYKPGMDLPVGYIKTNPSQTDAANVSVGLPGVLVLTWQPAVGLSNSPTSPASIVGKEVYAKVREKFSGSIDADAPDFVIYLMALDSIFSFIAHLKRIYRIINAYSPENYIVPDGLLRAFDFTVAQIQDLRQHKMELFQRINELVLMTRKFKCPRILDIFNRHVWLNDHVYTDAATIKSQFFLFSQTGWYKFTMLNVPNTAPAVQAGGLSIVAPTLTSTGVVESLYQFGRSLIDALAASDDGYLISGYLMRAYEGVPDFYVDELLLNEELVPKYNEEVLSEIENAHVLPDGYSQLDNTVYQDPSSNSIIAEPYVRYPKSSNAYKLGWDGIRPRYSSRSDVPTVAETVIHSRLMTYPGPFYDENDLSVQSSLICCSEILTQMWILGKTPGVGGANPFHWHRFASEQYVDISDTASPAALRALQAALTVSQWDWCPLLLVTVGNATSSETVIVGDSHNVTTTSLEELRNLNAVCMYSLFGAFQ